MGAEKKAAALRCYREDYAATSPANTRLFPGVSEALRTLQERGYTLAIATNKSVVFTIPILDFLGITSLFAVVMGPEKVLQPKPHPAMIDSIRATFHQERSQCLYVGDMPLDVKTASQAGVDCVLVATGAFSIQELEGEPCVAVLPRVTELPAFLAMNAPGP